MNIKKLINRLNPPNAINENKYVFSTPDLLNTPNNLPPKVIPQDPHNVQKLKAKALPSILSLIFPKRAKSKSP